MRTDLMFSSKTPEWATPQDLFDRLNKKYHFNLDPCCTDENAKCKKHYTVSDDGLMKPWGGHTVFCNPPYGRKIGKWVEKAYKESMNPNTLVVMLLPARTGTKWFHNYCVKGEIEFIQGRLKFGGCKNSAPFPSMIVVFKNYQLKNI